MNRTPLLTSLGMVTSFLTNPPSDIPEYLSRAASVTSSQRKTVGVTLEQARRLRAFGFSLVPLPLGSKEPDWSVLPKDEQGKPTWKPYQDQLPTDDQLQLWFGKGVQRNAGIIGRQLYVVVDGDSTEALDWMRGNLPDGAWKSRTNRGEHWFLGCPSGVEDMPASIKVHGNLSVEVKFGGPYVVAPGSVHPSGCVYEEIEPWTGSFMTLPKFPMSVFNAGTADRTRQHAEPLPDVVGDGSRNRTLFIEGCRLRRLGFDEPEILGALTAINERRCKPQLTEKEVKEITRSCAKYQNETPSAVHELNARYFILDVGSDTVVGEEVKEEAAKDYTLLHFRSFADFKKKLIKRTIQIGTHPKTGEPIYRSLADEWLKHPQGMQYDRLVYAPPGSSIYVAPNDLNGWKGFRAAPAPGSWTLTRDTFIRDIVCRGNADLFDWVLDWMAALFQQPGKHAETGLVCIGGQGIGKNIFADAVLAQTFDGRHARVTTHTRQVLGEFNSILSGLCLLVLDEVGLASEREYAAVRGLVTGHTIDINRKGIDSAKERSMLHIIFLSNAEVAFKVAFDDRRLTFLHFAETYKNDTTFFGAVVRELEQVGRAAMLHELLNRQVRWERLHHALDSELKQTAKREGWSFAQWFVFRKMREISKEAWNANLETLKSGDEVYRVAKKDWVSDYEIYVKGVDVRRAPRDAYSDLTRELRKLVPEGWDVNRVTWDETQQKAVRDYWTLPEWDVFKTSFEQAVGCALNDVELAPLPKDEVPF